MAAGWRDLAAALETRVTTFMRTGQPELVTGPAAEDLAGQIWLRAREAGGAVPLDAALPVARLYWARHQALAPRPPADDSDLGAAVAIFAMIGSVAPDAVPEELRPLVDEARQQAGQQPFSDAAAEAVDLLARVQAGREPSRLDEVIQRFRQLLAALEEHEASTGDQSTAEVHGALLSDLSLALHLRVERAGDPRDVAEAVRLAREALTTAGDGAEPGELAALLGNAAMILGMSFEYSGDHAELDEAIALCSRALDHLPAGHPGWARWASNLSGLYRIRFDRSDHMADLDRAIQLATQAAKLTPDDAHGAGLRWSNVSNSLDARYGWSGCRADLDAAIEAGRRAVQLTALADPDWGPIVANVCHLCLTRFERWGGLEDIAESIARAREALDGGTFSPPKRAALLSNLANAYRLRYEHLHRSGDLDEALAAIAEALQLSTGSDPWRASHLTNQAMIMLCDFERSARPEALDEALAAAREAVGLPGLRPSLRSKLFSNLAVVLAATAAAAGHQAGRAAALDEAVSSGRQAVAILPADHPDLAIRLNNLAGTLLDRAASTGPGQADVQDALGCYRQAAGLVTVPVSVRVQAARSQGGVAASHGDWPAALDGYTTAVGLLGTLVTRAMGDHADPAGRLRPCGRVAPVSRGRRRGTAGRRAQRRPF